MFYLQVVGAVFLFISECNGQKVFYAGKAEIFTPSKKNSASVRLAKSLCSSTHLIHGGKVAVELSSIVDFRQHERNTGRKYVFSPGKRY
jgi:hypothetical protein